MIDINLHEFKDALTLKKENGTTLILDIIRQKYLVFQPEELVRQLFVHYLISIGYPKEKIQVEKGLEINGIKRRFDIVVYDSGVKPHIVVECKSHKVAISQATFDQVVQYNMVIDAPLLVVTNGVQTYCCTKSEKGQHFKMLNEIPECNW